VKTKPTKTMIERLNNTKKDIKIYKDLDMLPIMDRLKILQKFKEINRESQKSAEEKQEKEIFLNKKIHKIMIENNFLNIGFCTNGKITDEYKFKEQYA
jgi:hypothetical protein